MIQKLVRGSRIKLAHFVALLGKRRVYHYHVRKTGGTAVNVALLSTSGVEGQKVYQGLNRARHHALTINGRRFVGWNRKLIQLGDYDFAFSHAATHKINLPPKTFRFTVLREPIARIVSHYKMLVGMKETIPDHETLKIEGKYLCGGLVGFLDNPPKEKLLHQLYMFSKKYDPMEAAKTARGLDMVLRTESLSGDVDKLGEKLGLDLTLQRLRESLTDYFPTKKELVYLNQVMGPEIDMYNRVMAGLE